MARYERASSHFISADEIRLRQWIPATDEPWAEAINDWLGHASIPALTARIADRAQDSGGAPPAKGLRILYQSHLINVARDFASCICPPARTGLRTEPRTTVAAVGVDWAIGALRAERYTVTAVTGLLSDWDLEDVPTAEQVIEYLERAMTVSASLAQFTEQARSLGALAYALGWSSRYAAPEQIMARWGLPDEPLRPTVLRQIAINISTLFCSADWHQDARLILMTAYPDNLIGIERMDDTQLTDALATTDPRIFDRAVTQASATAVTDPRAARLVATGARLAILGS